MSSISVYCGNGGDYEYEVCKYKWANWIAKNMIDCTVISNPRLILRYETKGFTIRPHREADKAIVQFDDPRNATWFILSAPQYM